MDVKELTLENIGIWPLWAKGVIIALLCSLILLMFYFFDVRPMHNRLVQARSQEQDLRLDFETKYPQAANLPAYKAQVIQIQKLIASVLRQLPKEIDVPSLIEDISKMGIAAGLEFKSIKPQDQVEKDFYTELPINITVSGNYHQLAEFISNLANLQKIVTLDNFTITHPDSGNVPKEPTQATRDQTTLTMTLTAKTFRQRTSQKEASPT